MLQRMKLRKHEKSERVDEEGDEEFQLHFTFKCIRSIDNPS